MSDNQHSANQHESEDAPEEISQDADQTQEHPDSEMSEEATEAAVEALAKALSGEVAEVSVEEVLAAKIAEAEGKLAEMKDQLLRAVAETENVRRRALRDVEEAGKYAVTSFARDMITVGENLQLALSSIPEEARAEEGMAKALADGVEMTLRELLSQLEKHGIIRVNPVGEKFDHNFHQAVSQVEDPKKEPGTVLHVMQAGYTIQGRLLRPAMVVVAKRGEPEQKIDTQA